jgi:hypothetical protein
MALPTIPPPPTVPSQEQPRPVFNANVAAFLTWMALVAPALDAWGDQLPTEFNALVASTLAALEAAFEDAVQAYDPDGAYSKVQVDALLAALETRAGNAAEDLALLYASAL